MHLFGRGLVPTVDNFGVGGELPSHPELLDWLAREFVERGWRRKALIRLIVTSAAYRQSSAGRDDLADRDPLNCLVARQSRLRLEAEVVRDAALSGLGIALLPDFSARDAMRDGRLVEVLPDWRAVGFFGDAIYAIHPWSSHTPQGVRLLVDHLKGVMGGGY